MGGTKILGCLLNSTDGIVKRVKRPTETVNNKNVYIKHLAEVVHEITDNKKVKKESIKAVCIGIPGSVNPFTGIIGLAPNLGIKNFPIKDKLQKIIPFPVLIENDVNLGGLGIKKYGWGKTAKNLLTVFVGTGIGGALFFDGKIYRGSSYIAGEIGHVVVEENGPLCGCGNYGCFEAVASRTAIARNITRDLKKSKGSVIKKLVEPGEKIKSKSLAQAIAGKDKMVIKHISDACNTIGIVLANTTNLLNLDMIVLGGGVIEALDYFMLPIIKESFNNHVLSEAGKKVKIYASKLGDDAAIYGGLALAEEFLNIKV